ARAFHDPKRAISMLRVKLYGTDQIGIGSSRTHPRLDQEFTELDLDILTILSDFWSDRPFTLKDDGYMIGIVCNIDPDRIAIQNFHSNQIVGQEFELLIQ